jgi:hypothetical protein
VALKRADSRCRAFSMTTAEPALLAQYARSSAPSAREMASCASAGTSSHEPEVEETRGGAVLLAGAIMLRELKAKMPAAAIARSATSHAAALSVNTGRADVRGRPVVRASVLIADLSPACVVHAKPV